MVQPYWFEKFYWLKNGCNFLIMYHCIALVTYFSFHFQVVCSCFEVDQSLSDCFLSSFRAQESFFTPFDLSSMQASGSRDIPREGPLNEIQSKLSFALQSKLQINSCFGSQTTTTLQFHAFIN